MKVEQHSETVGVKVSRRTKVSSERVLQALRKFEGKPRRVVAEALGVPIHVLFLHIEKLRLTGVDVPVGSRHRTPQTKVHEKVNWQLFAEVWQRSRTVDQFAQEFDPGEKYHDRPHAFRNMSRTCENVLRIQLPRLQSDFRMRKNETQTRLIEAWALYLTVAQVAEALGCSRSRVYELVRSFRRKGISLAPKPSTRGKRFSEVWNSSKNIAEVAERLNIKRATAEQEASRLRCCGVKLNKLTKLEDPRRWTEERIRAFCDVLNTSSNRAQAAERLHLCESYVALLASRFREKGYEIKKFHRRNSRTES